MKKTLVMLVLAALMVCVASTESVRAEIAPPPQPGLYAVYAWAGEVVAYYDDIRGAGFNWVRCGGWGRDANTEKAVALAARDGLNFVPTLEIGELGHGKTMPLEQAVSECRRMAADNVLRYGPGGSFWAEHPELPANPIRYWGLWNEPNIEFLTPPSDDVLRTELYAKLLTAVSEEIRRLDPGARIIAFNTAGGCPDGGQALKADGMFQKLKYIGWRKFIRDAAAAVSPESYDFIGTHPYTNPRSPERGTLDGLDMVEELGLNKPIWFTEVGFALEYPRKRQVRDEDQQAAYMVRLFAIAGAQGVVQVQVMFVTDIIYGPDSSRRSFGMFTTPGEWRKQATATRVMSRLIPDPREGVRVLSQMPGGLFAYRFAGPEASTVTMAWNSADKADRASFPAEKDRDYCLVDMLGAVRPLAPQEGRLIVSIGEAPVYIVSQAADVVAEWLKQEN